MSRLQACAEAKGGRGHLRQGDRSLVSKAGWQGASPLFLGKYVHCAHASRSHHAGLGF
jgi:hypothetical protein